MSNPTIEQTVAQQATAHSNQTTTTPANDHPIPTISEEFGSTDDDWTVTADSFSHAVVLTSVDDPFAAAVIDPSIEAHVVSAEEFQSFPHPSSYQHHAPDVADPIDRRMIGSPSLVMPSPDTQAEVGLLPDSAAYISHLEARLQQLKKKQEKRTKEQAKGRKTSQTTTTHTGTDRGDASTTIMPSCCSPHQLSVSVLLDQPHLSPSLPLKS